MAATAVCFMVSILGSAFAGDCRLRIGTNLTAPVDWGSEWPFVDIMKYCRTWITFNSVWLEAGENPWDTGVVDRIPADENGYPLELPFTVAGTETTQVVRAVWANTFSLPEGVYTVLYDGEGTVDVEFDGSIISQEPGRILFDLRHRDRILSVNLLESRRGNHVRNIRVLMPGTESTHAQNPWCAEWLEKLEPFRALRFMDWGLTNNSALMRWEDRPVIGDYTYTQAGVPYEWMIEICNRKKADCWVCIPHQADADYIRNMAVLFRDGLDPSLKIHVEYSNEIWNWMFDQTHWLFENGDQAVDWPERIVPFIQNSLDIWTDAFSGQTERLIRTVGVQGAWQDVSNRVVFNMRPGSFDAFSPAAYFGFSDSAYAALSGLGASATAEDVLLWARRSVEGQSAEWLRTQYETISRTTGLPMIYYEGGQHLTPDPFGSDQPYGQALMDAQILPGMYDLYCQWFDTLRGFIPDGRTGLLMNFSFIGERDGRYGSWGVLESQFHQSPPYGDTAPKYQAILDALCDPGSGISRANLSRDGLSLSLNPNPFNASVRIRFHLPEHGRITLTAFDVRGRQITVLLDEERPAGENVTDWDASGLASGPVLIRLKAGPRIEVRKCLLVR
ncbi:hypothetical protein JW777_06575 [bacterium]|nr:hypothetical protein [bacterium]